MSGKRKKRKMKVWQKVLLFFLEIVVLAVVVIAWYIVDKFSKLEIQEIDREAIDLVIAPEVKANEALKGYTNYLLLGTDARDNSIEAMTSMGEGNTDAIIIASLNNDTKEVKLVSIYRSSAGTPRVMSVESMRSAPDAVSGTITAVIMLERYR